ncbi:MAG: hypothetical protein WAM82_02360 [Thermoanaerobaculia bacterium]
MRLMLSVLSGCYALAGVFSPVAPLRSVIFLSLACGLVTMLYFLIRRFQNQPTEFVVAIIMAVVTYWLGDNYPRLTAILFVIGLFRNFSGILKEMVNLMKNLPLVLSGMMLYGVLLLPCIPSFSRFIDAQGWPIRSAVCLAAGIISVLLLLALLRLLDGYYPSRADTAAIMLGFGSFLTVTFLSLFLAIVKLKPKLADGGPPSDDNN